MCENFVLFKLNLVTHNLAQFQIKCNNTFFSYPTYKGFVCLANSTQSIFETYTYSPGDIASLTLSRLLHERAKDFAPTHPSIRLHHLWPLWRAIKSFSCKPTPMVHVQYHCSQLSLEAIVVFSLSTHTFVYVCGYIRV